MVYVMPRLRGGARRGGREKLVRLYLPPDVSEDVAQEAVRLDRSRSWLLQIAWSLSRGRLRTLPSAEEWTGTGPPDENGASK